MISQPKVEEVRKLLAEGGRSQRQIAKLAGVSRGTVGGIAQGKRRDRIDAPDDDERRGPVVRCPECGGKVYSPCVLCRTRRLKSAERSDRRRTAGRTPESVVDARRRDDPTVGG